jgi:hypothetical protein
MANASHLTALVARHSELESQIAGETNRPHPDELQIMQWKKQKLRLKDEILRAGA